MVCGIGLAARFEKTLTNEDKLKENCCLLTMCLRWERVHSAMERAGAGDTREREGRRGHESGPHRLSQVVSQTAR